MKQTGMCVDELQNFVLVGFGIRLRDGHMESQNSKGFPCEL